MRLGSYDYYAPDENVLGHSLIYYDQRYVVTREEIQRGIPMLYIVTEEYEDGMVRGIWIERNDIANPHETLIYWHPDKTRAATRAVCDDLYARAQDAERVRRRQALANQERSWEEQMLFEQFLREKAPADAKAILVAELFRNKSHSIFDYFFDLDYLALRLVRCVFLGFSKSDRNSFAEMRKLAATYAPTASLAGPDGVEHRENDTGGNGYYLGGASSCSGWTVRKYVLPERPLMRVDYWPWLEKQGQGISW